VKTVAWAASNGDRSENGDYIYGKKRLREIDRRIRFLLKELKEPKLLFLANPTASFALVAPSSWNTRTEHAKNSKSLEKTKRILQRAKSAGNPRSQKHCSTKSKVTQ
jgi:glutathione S-transferase